MMSTASLTRSNNRGSDFELAYASPVILKDKGADDHSIELHNSRKQQPVPLYGEEWPVPPHDEEGKIGNDGRKRRSRGSCDDQGKLTEDGFSNEYLRVGGPYLCSIPLSSTGIPKENPISSLLMRKSSNGQGIRERVDAILMNADIQLYSSWPRGDSLGVGLCQSKFNPEPEPVPTLFITAVRQVINDTWLQVVRQIHSLLCEEGFPHVSVEIYDPHALESPHTSPIQPNEKIFLEWDAVLAKILKIIELHDVLTIGCYRRGRSLNTSENAATVLVIVDINSRKEWKTTRDSITEILSDFSLHMVAVKIVKDRINLLWRETAFKEEILGAHLAPGGPIAALKRKDSFGTLGGIIELQDPTENSWLRFALTCFHVVDLDDRDVVGSQDLAAIHDWRQNGLPFYQYKKAPREFAVLARNMKISHPSLLAKKKDDDLLHKRIKDIKRSLTYEQASMLRDQEKLDELSGHKKDRFHSMEQEIHESETNLDRTAKFFEQSKNVLGPVAAGSGYKTIQCHTLGDERYPTEVDWAIISIDPHWSVSNKIDEEISLWYWDSPEGFQHIGKGYNHNLRLQFQGYGSGRGQVVYNDLKVAKIDPKSGNLKSLGYSACGNDKYPPATKGDSGALLFTWTVREVVGMLVAGTEFNKIVYFTRIDDLREDIMKCTGAKDFRIYDDGMYDE